MNRFSRVLLSVLIFLCASDAIAQNGKRPQPALIEPTDEECSDSRHIARCTAWGKQETERAMNEALEEAINNFQSSEILSKRADAEAEEKERIRAGQEAWLKYRDAHCLYKYYSKSAIHSGYEQSRVSSCMTNKNIQRTKEIRDRYLY